MFLPTRALIYVLAVVSLLPEPAKAEQPDGPTMRAPHVQESEKVSSMTFYEHDEYKNLTHGYDYLWDDLLPPNGGFIRKHYQNGQIHGHGISMFHQLHCLAIMRSAYQAMEEKIGGPDREGNDPDDSSQHEHRQSETSPKTHEHLGKGHWLHCFDYLCQAILCNADATVEVPLVDKKGNPVVDGMVKRKCNNWKALWDVAVNSDRMSDIQ